MHDSAEFNVGLHRAIADFSEGFLARLLEAGLDEITTLGSGLLEIDLRERSYRHRGRSVSLPPEIAEHLADRLMATLESLDIDTERVSSAVIRADLAIDSRPVEGDPEAAAAAVTKFRCTTEVRLKIADVVYRGVHVNHASRVRAGG